MSVLYKPTGPAYEYAEIALNLYKGCRNGCFYCYAPKSTRVSPEIFSKKEYIRVRPNIIQQLKKEIVKFQNNQNINILLSFTSDCYQELEKELQVTREALEIISFYNVPFTVLTKSGSWGLVRDMDLFKKNPNNCYSATLTLDNHEHSRQFEPNAPLPEDRIEALRIAKEVGIKTWASFEPVLYSEQTLNLIEISHKYIDLLKVGKFNAKYKTQKAWENSIDWKLFRTQAIELLEKLNCKYIIKKDLLKA